MVMNIKTLNKSIVNNYEDLSHESWKYFSNKSRRVLKDMLDKKGEVVFMERHSYLNKNYKDPDDYMKKLLEYSNSLDFKEIRLLSIFNYIKELSEEIERGKIVLLDKSDAIIFITSKEEIKSLSNVNSVDIVTEKNFNKKMYNFISKNLIYFPLMVKYLKKNEHILSNIDNLLLSDLMLLIDKYGEEGMIEVINNADYNEFFNKYEKKDLGVYLHLLEKISKNKIVCFQSLKDECYKLLFKNANDKKKQELINKWLGDKEQDKTHLIPIEKLPKLRKLIVNYFQENKKNDKFNPYALTQLLLNNISLVKANDNDYDRGILLKDIKEYYRISLKSMDDLKVLEPFKQKNNEASLSFWQDVTREILWDLNKNNTFKETISFNLSQDETTLYISIPFESFIYLERGDTKINLHSDLHEYNSSKIYFFAKEDRFIFSITTKDKLKNDDINNILDDIQNHFQFINELAVEYDFFGSLSISGEKRIIAENEKFANQLLRKQELVNKLDNDNKIEKKSKKI